MPTESYGFAAFFSTGHREGEGNVKITRLDGSTVTFKNVRVDSVSPSAEAKGVIGIEFFDSDRVIHVPFVSHWEFEYDL